MTEWTDWLTPLLAFVGAALGAGATWWGMRRETTQQDRQGQREEWGRRFTAALADITDSDPDPDQVRSARALIRLVGDQSQVDPVIVKIANAERMPQHDNGAA